MTQAASWNIKKLPGLPGFFPSGWAGRLARAGLSASKAGSPRARAPPLRSGACTRKRVYTGSGFLYNVKVIHNAAIIIGDLLPPQVSLIEKYGPRV